jgi:cold shock protein
VSQVASTSLASHNSIPAQRGNLHSVPNDLRRDHSRHVENLPLTATRVTGTVKFFNRQKSYGFIVPAGGGRNIFVHADDLVNAESLHWGQEVEYELVDVPAGPRAKDVRVIGGRK